MEFLPHVNSRRGFNRTTSVQRGARAETTSSPQTVLCPRPPIFFFLTYCFYLSLFWILAFHSLSHLLLFAQAGVAHLGVSASLPQALSQPLVDAACLLQLLPQQGVDPAEGGAPGGEPRRGVGEGLASR